MITKIKQIIINAPNNAFITCTNGITYFDQYYANQYKVGDYIDPDNWLFNGHRITKYSGNIRGIV